MQVVLKSGSSGTKSSLLPAATATAVAGDAGVPAAAESLATLSAASVARVPIGAEAARASSRAAQAAAAAGGLEAERQQQPQDQEQQQELRLCDVQEVVMLYIPDGHTKTEAAMGGQQQR